MDYKAIANVGEALIKLLREKMEVFGVAGKSIVLFSPGEIDSNDDVRLSLFLYQVLENFHLKNQEMQIVDSKKLKFPPLNLDLYYMLTSHPPSGIQDKTARSLEEHTVLGLAVKVLNDNPVLTVRQDKNEERQDKNEELHITITSMSLEDLTKIWTTFPSKPFRPSVCYLVTPAKIDSGRDDMSVQRVVSKETDDTYMVPEKGEK